MLMFFDESYERLASGEFLHVYAGFGIEMSKYRRLVASIHQLKKEYLRTSDNLSPEQRAEEWKKHYLVRGNPEDAELKAKDLLSMTTLMNQARRGFAAGYSLASDVLQECSKIGITTFGVISFPSSIASIQHESESLPLHMQRIMERVNLWMEEEHEQRQAAFVLDTLDNRTNPVLSRHFTEFLLKSSAGKRMRHIVPSPFWIDSRITAGCQVADLVSHVLMNSARDVPHRKEGLQSLWKEIMRNEYRSYNGKTHGIQKMRRQA